MTLHTVMNDSMGGHHRSTLTSGALSGHPTGYELCHPQWHSHHQHICDQTMRPVNEDCRRSRKAGACSLAAAARLEDQGKLLVNISTIVVNAKQIISPAIDMIELISARGNTTLESAVTLTKSLRWDIQSLGSRVEKAVVEEQLSKRGSSRAKSRAQNDFELKMIIADMKQLLHRIEDAVPLINLAITTSGVSLSTNLPPTVSPSRLLQASTFLTTACRSLELSRLGRLSHSQCTCCSLAMLSLHTRNCFASARAHGKRSYTRLE